MTARIDSGGRLPASGVPGAGPSPGPPGPPGPAARGAPAVSVVIPARDAEATIVEALDSVLAQDYSGAVEVIVADGSDTPDISDLVRRRCPGVRVVANPGRNAAAGLATGIRAARAGIVARCDAHAVLPPGYLRRAVETLSRTGAANVGGRQHPVGRTFFERAVALAMTTWLGAGGARYRLGGPEGPADTVYLGVFRRDLLDAVGGVDPAMAANEDYELNWRLRERGETVWFDPALAVAYRPRGTLAGLARQYYRYGRWKSAMLRRHPSSLRVRQLAAPLLVLGLAVSSLLAWTSAAGAAVATALPAVWLLALLLGSAAAGVRRREPAAVLAPLALAAMHLSWGAGFLLSLVRAPAGASRS